MLTRREQLIILLKRKKYTLQELANKFAVKLSEIEDDIPRLKKTIHPKKLKRKHARCLHCGFVFKERSKVKKPSKCPRCRGEQIKPSVFWIK